MENNTSIYNIYKRTFIAVIVAAIFVTGIAFAYSFFMTPQVFSGKKLNTVSHGVSEMSESATGVENSLSTSEVETGFELEGLQLTLSDDNADSEYMWIPVPEGTSINDVTIENHYMDRQLWVTLSGNDDSFYKEAEISGKLDGVSYGNVIQDDGKLILKFALDTVYEYNSIFENDVLYIERVNPHEIYDRIVVIDPDGRVPESLINSESLTPARICLDIATKLQENLEKEGVRVYITRLDDRDISDEMSINLAGEVRPDMLVRIETAYDEDSKVYGTETVYNGTYFIPGFGSVELADLIEANVTTAIGGRASGLIEAGEGDEVILKATVPAASVRVGYYTNTQENILLNRDDYRGRIATGLYQAIMLGFGDE